MMNEIRTALGPLGFGMVNHEWTPINTNGFDILDSSSFVVPFSESFFFQKNRECQCFFFS